MDIIYMSVRSSSRRVRVDVNGLMWGIIILASYGHPFSRVYENLPQLPSHNISIIAKID